MVESWGCDSDAVDGTGAKKKDLTRVGWRSEVERRKNLEEFAVIFRPLRAAFMAAEDAAAAATAETADNEWAHIEHTGLPLPWWRMHAEGFRAPLVAETERLDKQSLGFK